MMRRLTHQPVIAWLAFGLWLAWVVFLMLSPGEDSVAEDLSGAFGASELTDALGHVVLFGVLTVLLFHALRLHVPVERALKGAAVFVLALGSVLEPAQLLVYERGAALLDLAANWAGALVAAALLRRIALPSRPERERVRAAHRPDIPPSRR